MHPQTPYMCRSLGPKREQIFFKWVHCYPTCQVVPNCMFQVASDEASLSPQIADTKAQKCRRRGLRQSVTLQRRHVINTRSYKPSSVPLESHFKGAGSMCAGWNRRHAQSESTPTQQRTSKMLQIVRCGQYHPPYCLQRVCRRHSIIYRLWKGWLVA